MDELERNANGQEPIQGHPLLHATFDISNHFRRPETSEGYARIGNIHFLNFLQPANFGGTNESLNFDGNNQTNNGGDNLDNNQMEIADFNFTGNNQMNVANVNFDGKNQLDTKNANYEGNNQANGNQSNVRGFETNPDSVMSVPPLGFIQPGSMDFCPMPFPPMDVQYNMPMVPMGSQFNMAAWGGIHQQVLSVPPGYLVGPPPELIQYEHLSRPMNHSSHGWNIFDGQKSQQRVESFPVNFSKEDGRFEPWLKSRFRPQYAGTGCFEGSIQHMSRDERFKVQLTRFPALPYEIHRRLRNMSAYEIVANFVVSLDRIRANCIIDTSTCHVVFTKKPDTEQYWLMAIALTEDSRTSIKFNRLLTSHVKVKVNGAKAVELTPSKVGPGNDEVYVFNFSLEKDAINFIDVLDKGRHQVWNHLPPPPVPPQNFVMEEQYYHSPSQDFPNEQKPQRLPSKHGNAFSNRRPYRKRVNRTPALNYLKGKFWPELEAVEQERSRAAESGQELNKYDYGNLKFVKYKATADIFHKCGSEYMLLASGEMNIVSHDDSFDEVVFVSSKKVICHHEIYQWHKLRFERHENVYVCKWMAATYLTGSKNVIPAARELKMEVKTEAAISDFFLTFQEAIEKAIKITNVPVV